MDGRKWRPSIALKKLENDGGEALAQNRSLSFPQSVSRNNVGHNDGPHWHGR